MSFASIHFIFLFLPIVFLLYSLAPRGNWRNAVLVLGSLVFFAWVDFKNLHLLLALIGVNYLFGLWLGYLQRYDKPKISRGFLWTAVILNLLFLSFHKYLGLFSQALLRLTDWNIPSEKPGLILGLSYLCFSSLSYLWDVYHQVTPPEKNLITFSAYLVMFPKMVQGPITLYRDMAPQRNPTRVRLDALDWGIKRFIIGLAKKVIIADSLSMAVNRVFVADPRQLGAGVAWFGLLSYTLVIYFDFSGYTDMAIGLGRMFGFVLPENFNAPYLSRNITEFWRRWHISLTSWFRTYVFIPLEFKRRRSKFLRQQINIIVVFLLTGLWHGASWNFVIWGGYFGLILALEASGWEKILKRAPRVLQHVYTLLIVMIGWVFFGIKNVKNWGPFFGALLGMNGFTHLETLRSLNILIYFPILILAILLCLPIWSSIKKKLDRQTTLSKISVDLALFAVFLLSVAQILSNGFKVFMYARF